MSAAILAAVLYGREPDQSAVTLSTWNWLSIPEPRRLSLELGFEATWVRAAIVSLAGSGILAATWTGLVRKKALFFNAVYFANSLIFAAAVGFVFAPNLTQSLLGWGCISLLVSVLIRVTNGPIDPVAARKTASNSSNDYLSSATRVLHGVGVAVVEGLGRGLTIRFPAWVGEQFEVIEASPVSTQLLAIVLGACSVLLTWLIVT